MAEEIIYTSAEKGLKQGSRGFCTVVSTAGMAGNLAERLESMSGYRHAFPLHDPKTSLNPVCFSHLTTRMAGKILHVISRVADAGQDYTGRSNKLAHHLVLGPLSDLQCGPARLLSHPGILVTKWDGTVRQTPPRKIDPPEIPATIRLTHWHQVSGDGGWAGAVAEMLLQSSAPVSIIFSPGTDTLSLVREILDLIPPSQRWNVTFSTYFTRLLAGTECQLRFVLDETAEATALRNDARALLIDLTIALPPAKGGSLVETARRGELTPEQSESPAIRFAHRSQAPRESVEIARVVTPQPAVQAPVVARLPDRGTVIDFGPGRTNTRRPIPFGLFVTLGLIVFAVGAGAIVWYLNRNVSGNDGFSDIVQKAIPNAELDSATTQADDEAVRIERLNAEKAEEQQRLAAQREAKQRQQAENELAEKTKTEEEEDRKQRELAAKRDQEAREQRRREEIKKAGPFVYISGDDRWRDDHQQWLFELPPPDPDAEVSMKLPIRAHSEIPELSLCKSANSLFEGADYQLELVPSNENPLKWTAVAIQGVKADQRIELAEYTFEKVEPKSDEDFNYQLDFQWLRDAQREQPAAELLRWWPLQIRVGDRMAVFLQRKPERPDSSAASTVPTWKMFKESKKISMVSTPAIQAFPLRHSKAVQFIVEVTQEGQPPEIMTLGINTDPAQTDNATESDDEANPEETATRHLFSLQSPLKLLPKDPEVNDQLLGFVELHLEAFQEDKGLVLAPNMELVVRLPAKEPREHLPAPAHLEYLKDMIKDPVATLPQFNPNLVDPLITDLRKTCEGLRNDNSRWHRQQLKNIPKRQIFERIPFFGFSDKAKVSWLRDVKESKANLTKWENQHKLTNTPGSGGVGNQTARENVLRYGKEVAIIDQNYDLAQKQYNLASSDRLKKQNDDFKNAMTRVDQEMRGALVSLTKNYDAIQSLVNDFIQRSETFQVRCTVSGNVETPGVENGDSIRVYFLETQSSAGTAIRTTGDSP